MEVIEKISVPTKINTTGAGGILKQDGTYQAGLTFRKNGIIWDALKPWKKLPRHGKRQKLW